MIQVYLLCLIYHVQGNLIFQDTVNMLSGKAQELGPNIEDKVGGM